MNKLPTTVSVLALILIAGASAIFGQVPAPKPAAAPAQRSEPGPIKSSPAYAEVLLRKTELEADLLSFTEDYTDQNPKVIDARFELATLSKDIDRLFSVRPDDVQKLTLALGKLIVRRAAVETELNRLLRTYKPDHPEAKRARKKAELFRDALKDILGSK